MCCLIALLFPFIYPIIANVFIKLKLIVDIEQLKEYINMFKAYNIGLIILILIFLKHYFGISFSEFVEKITTNIDFNIKKGEHEINFHMPIKDCKGIDSMLKESKEVAREGIIEEKNICKLNCSECEIKNVKEENESLRFFSAYQITNKFSRELLKKIIENDKIELDIFIENMNEYYNRTIKNMSKKRKKEFIQQKVNELLYNLRYLNLIEYTEDDKYIILTQKGIEFVKGYTEEVG